VAENVLDLMRFVPEYTPWGGRQNKQQPSLSLHSLVTEGAPVLGPSGSNYTVSLGNRTAGTIGLFFGAAWSQPCTAFLPLLQAAYKAVQQKAVESSGSETEFIFVSLDQSLNSTNFGKKFHFLLFHSMTAVAHFCKWA